MISNSQKLTAFQQNAILCFMALIVLSWMLVNDASAYERKVLFEDFTACDCPPCAACADEVEAAIEAVGDLVVPIAIHLTVGAFDPWWDDNSADASTRSNYYGVHTIPHFYIDGDEYTGARERGAFENAIENHSQEDSPLEIKLNVLLANNELDISVEVTSNENLNSLNLYVALTEDHVEYDARNNQQDHYDAMVKMIPNGGGSRFSIEADETREFEFNQNMDGLGWHELIEDNLILVCWVQDSNHDVLQAQNKFVSASVVLDDLELSDADGGNGDGRPEPGETIETVVSLSVPEGRMDVEECLVSIFCDDNELEFTVSEFNTGGIGSGEQITNEDNPFSFSIPNDMEAHPVNFIITVEAQPGDWEAEYDFETMIGWPDILLIDVTEDVDATEAMMGVFGDHNLPWVDYLNLAEEVVIPDNLLSHYDAVLWYTFNCEESMFFEFEEVTLSDYLDAGGTLIMSSPYIVLDYGNIDFFSEYMGAGLENADLASRYVYSYEGSGCFEGTNAFLGGGDGAGFATATPGLSAEGSGEAVLYYPDDDQIAGIAGIKNETDDFRTLLLSFPIESIGGAASTEERYEFLGRIWNWINGEHGVFDGDYPQVNDFRLDAAYPNPFNSTSVIPFNLAQSGNITLKLYNTAGREVGQVVNGTFNAGNYKVTLDASKFGLTTGVYYLQLDGKNGTSTGKVLYIR